MFERIYKVTRVHKVCRNSNLPGRNSHSRPVVGIPSMSSNWRPIILPGQESRPGSNSNLPGRNSKQQFENFLPGRNSNKGFANFYRVGICSHLVALFFLFGLRATHCNTKHLFDNIHHYNSIMMQFNNTIQQLLRELLPLPITSVCDCT